MNQVITCDASGLACPRHTSAKFEKFPGLDISKARSRWPPAQRCSIPASCRVLVRATEQDDTITFPRRQLIYSLVSKPAPGDVVAVSYGCILAAAVVVTLTAPDHLATGLGVDGVSLLGVYVLIASSVERFLEPLKHFLDVEKLKDDELDAFSEQVGVAINAIKRSAPEYDAREVVGAVTKLGKGAMTTGGVSALLAQAGDGNTPQAASDAVAAARKSEISVKRIRRNTSVLFWGFASCVSMFLSEGCGVGILHTVGLEDVSIPLDIVITGLAVGAGTQPLNKLLAKLEG